LRGKLVRIQGASKAAYFPYSAFGATQNTGQKTSKIVDLFFPMTLMQGAGRDAAIIHHECLATQRFLNPPPPDFAGPSQPLFPGSSRQFVEKRITPHI